MPDFPDQWSLAAFSFTQKLNNYSKLTVELYDLQCSICSALRKLSQPAWPPRLSQKYDSRRLGRMKSAQPCNRESTKWRKTAMRQKRISIMKSISIADIFRIQFSRYSTKLRLRVVFTALLTRDKHSFVVLSSSFLPPRTSQLKVRVDVLISFPVTRSLKRF